MLRYVVTLDFLKSKKKIVKTNDSPTNITLKLKYETVKG
ncbi:unnamed protein product [Staphylococcus haemolyticus JCSC1435]|uniref:Uncharacterized protein n=1 Tax=Staphylococcus haemolyticus (strain JCSC1435) TaxID=279808 RepID=Q4L8C7_STAHJ|nr:unnamed protein product [Staphylococcus haemolyticus JCSC1435]